MYVERDLEPHLLSAIEQFPAVLVTGPRQAGKSTFVQHCLKGYTYVSLDAASDRTLARQDPELFLNTYTSPVIIDEIQYAPELLSYIKIRIDKNRTQKGQFVLTGSQIFQLMEGVTESLAGRIAILQLYPFSWSEVLRADPSLNVKDPRTCAAQIVHGFYPELFQPPPPESARWYDSYITTYLERDVRNIQAVTDLDLFQRFLSLLATRVGGLLNLAEVAKECGVSQPTARKWVSILQATYTIFLLKPYFNNRSKRIVKSPKLYFIDTGLLSALLGIDSADRLLKAAERGALFENMVIIEWLKRESLLTSRPPLYFYRTTRGVEVDLLVERPEQLTAFEIKFSQTLTSNMADPLQRFLSDHPKAKGYLLSLHEDLFPLNRQVEAVHWSDGVDLL